MQLTRLYLMPVNHYFVGTSHTKILSQKQVNPACVESRWVSKVAYIKDAAMVQICFA
jgi:hypothetical protein